MSHLDTLRAIYLLAETISPAADIDADLRVEAGMDGNLQRLLQAARQLDEADEADAAASQ